MTEFDFLVDSHVNLHSEKFAEDLPELFERATAANVRAMLTISDKIDSTDAIKAIVRGRKNIWRSVGAHPHYAVDHPDLTAEFLIDLARDDDVVGIGECGLDFHYNYSPREEQMHVFGLHVRAAQETGLPLIIHTREADDEMLAFLSNAMKQKPFIPLLHCYTGGVKLAEAVMEMGGYISFSGILTFKNAEDVRNVARTMPRDRIIIETDCPYLAPVPMRGRRCEPAHLEHVATGLATILELDRAEVVQLTTENFFRLFGRAKFDESATTYDQSA